MGAGGHWADLGLLQLLDDLRDAGITFDLDRRAHRPELVWSKTPTAEGRRRLEPFLPWLEHVVVGRYTGHAPAVCSVCGELAMVPIVSTSGTRRGRKSAPWSACRMSNGWHGERVRRGRYTATLKRCPGVMIIREIDFEGVARVRPPGIPQLGAWLRKRGRPVIDERPAGQPWPGVDESATVDQRIARGLAAGVDPDHIEVNRARRS